ncbi:DoxX family protein [Litorisediminicola beolgyonensis]|uniref:DoxX family protein n=1 Tax=Litorisediminicola beolgyonensis TaxID=1173614 RepID=A0ABW3ZGM0_9RHOB
MTFLAPFRPQLLSVLRIMTALLMLQHGLTKVVNWPTSDFNGVPLTTPPGFAGILELVFGALLLIGLFSRLAAFILSGTMAVAYFLAHAPQGFFPMLNGGELAVLYCFTLLYLAAAGPGPWSVDAARGR